MLEDKMNVFGCCCCRHWRIISSECKQSASFFKPISPTSQGAHHILSYKNQVHPN